MGGRSPGTAGSGGLRVLLTCRAYLGHLLAMAPLAGALLEGGHDVACASGPSLEADVARLGLRFFRAGPSQASAEERAARFPETLHLAPEEIRTFFFGRIFGAYEAPERAADLAAVVDRWHPDVIVHDVAELGAPVVAASRGLPFAAHGYGLVLAPDAVAAAAEGVAPLWRSAGLAPHPTAGLWEHLYLDICPPSLQASSPPPAPVVQRIRPASTPAAAGAPRDRAVRPLVYVTLGTVSNHATGVFRTILDGLAPLPVDVLVTVGPHGDPSALAPTPPNVRVERFVPQEEVLPLCSVVVTHCGAGSALGALAHGRPLLAVPQGADQFANAARVVAVGAGVRLLPAEVSAEGVRAALRRLLGDEAYTAAARRLRDEIATMPDPSEGVAALVRLVDRPAGAPR